ncbi:hypothetical protein [Borrelia sp. HM]|uniref:hypothetical protein n=1 Tax=Borrelia sp. HM TaxID=1882662 RepID=UPI001C783F11|nr:hypothetical protein [Borrelia sp. HM]BCR22109.1 hypothetical protein BKFM_00699 [Borrelia sp. HM]
MRLKILNDVQPYKCDFGLVKPSLSGQLEVVRSIGINKWLVSFVGRYFEVDSCLPLKVGFKYPSRMMKTSKSFLISINYESVFENLDLFKSGNKLIIKRNGDFIGQNIKKLFSDIYDNVKDGFVLKFLLALHEQNITKQDFMKIYNYFSSEVERKEWNAKLPIFIENGYNFIISIPFRFLDSSGLLFLFSNKNLKIIYKWSFIYFFNKSEKIICEINNAGFNYKLRIYSDFNLDTVIEKLKSSLFDYNIIDIQILDSMQELSDFDCEIRVVKSVNYTV